MGAGAHTHETDMRLDTEHTIFLLAIPAVMLAILLLSLPAGACEPSLKSGLVCPEQLPPVYATVCQDGCFLSHRDDMREYKAAVAKAALWPEFLLRLERAQQLSALVVVQRDEQAERADLASEALALRTHDLLEAQSALADAPGWSTVLVGGAVGVAVGIVATVVMWVAL